MKDLPWFTIATLLVSLSNALAGFSGSLTPEQASIAATAAIVMGGIGKAIFNIGEGLKTPTQE